MTIQYKGENKEEDRTHPEAWIWYDEDNKEITEKASKLIEILESKRWECFNEDGFTIVPLYLGRYDYENLLWDYKEVKKAVGVR